MSVLVAVADDRVREQVLDTAVRLGEAFGEELYIVHLTEDSRADDDARSVRDDVREELSNELIEFSVSIEYAGHTGGRSGTTVGRQLADITDEVAVTHAVIGHRSKDLFGSLLQGNTAFAVAEAASVPVTVVPESVVE